MLLNFEITSYCNADCPSCFRTVFDECVPKPYKHLSVEDFELLIFNNVKFFLNQREMYKQQVQHSLKYTGLTAKFCGEIGDPLISPHIEKLIKLAKTVFDTIEIYTNGGSRTTNWIKKILLNNKKLQFIFGIDGMTNESNQVYRVNVRTDIAFKNMIESAKHRYTRWDYTIFNHNFHELKDVIDFSKTHHINLLCRFNGREFNKIDDKNLRGCEELLLKNDISYYICK